MKTTLRHALTIWLLLISALFTYGQSVKISQMTQVLTLPGNSFIQIVVTNSPATNYIVQVSNLFSIFGVQSQSNATFTIVQSATNFTSTVVFTNGLLTTSIPWNGPTNSLTLGLTNHYFFNASTSCSVTNFQFDSTYVSPSILTISNISTTNITFWLPTGCNLPDGDTLPYTITNGHVLKCSLERADGMINSVTRMFTVH